MCVRIILGSAIIDAMASADLLNLNPLEHYMYVCMHACEH